MADQESTNINEDQFDDSEQVDTADEMSWDDADDNEQAEESSDELDGDLEDDSESVDSESEDETEEQSEESDDEEQSDEEPDTDEARKQQARERYEQRQVEKAARENRIRNAQAQYVAEANQSEDPLAAQVRQLEVTTYNTTVQANEGSLTNSYNKALNDFPVLNSEDPAIRAEVDAAIDAFQSQYVTIDRFDNPYEIRGDLYQYLQAKADSISRLTGIREQKQEQAKAKQKSKSLTPPSRTVREPKVDPELAAFDEEAGL